MNIPHTLLNRVTSGLYAPGSTFKMVVLAAAGKQVLFHANKI